MKQVDPAFRAWLDSNPTIVRHGLVEIRTVPGGTYCYSNGDISIEWGGRMWVANGPLLERDTATHRLGIEVSELRLTARARQGDRIGSIPLVQAARSGLLDDAAVTWWDALFAPGEIVPRGVVHQFEGKVGDAEVTRHSLEIQVLSFLHQLNIEIPRGRFQPQCLRTLYDPGCGVNRSSWTRALQANADSSRLVVMSNLAEPDHQFAGGTLTGTTGGNVGVSRTVRGFSGGTFSLMTSLPVDVAPGDRFDGCPGCNRSMERCTSFDNLRRFRGMPFVPQPEASL